MTLASLARQHPRWVDAGIHIDRAPAAAWLGLQAAALLPAWVGMAQRWRHGDGATLAAASIIAALAALGWRVWQRQRDMRAAPGLGWLALGAALTLGATTVHAGHGGFAAASPAVTGWLTVAALACSALAFVPRRLALVPLGAAPRRMPALRLPAIAAPVERLFANTFVHRAAHKTLFGLTMVACLGWSTAGAWRAPAAPSGIDGFRAVSLDCTGVPLRTLAHGAVEERLAQRFPDVGALAACATPSGAAAHAEREARQAMQARRAPQVAGAARPL